MSQSSTNTDLQSRLIGTSKLLQWLNVTACGPQKPIDGWRRIELYQLLGGWICVRPYHREQPASECNK
ncbi:MAG: hypothetical protein ACI8TF_001343 [Paracoccaceae bacterium]|jgi:hypothetical protein